MKYGIDEIKDQEEYDKVWEYLIKTAMDTLNISREQAELRILAIKKSGIITQLGDPNEKPFQIGIDVAMRIPQLNLEDL